jgi:hypothetical protein
MAYFSVQLQLADGGHSRWISPREAQQLIDKGEAVRSRRKAHQGFEALRLKPQPSPSTSPDSTPVLTFADTETLAGAREASRARMTTLRAKQLLFRPIQLPVVYVGA